MSVAPKPSRKLEYVRELTVEFLTYARDLDNTAIRRGLTYSKMKNAELELPSGVRFRDDECYDVSFKRKDDKTIEVGSLSYSYESQRGQKEEANAKELIFILSDFLEEPANRRVLEDIINQKDSLEVVGLN